MSARTILTLVCLAILLGALTLYRNHARRVANQRALAALVSDLKPFADAVTQVNVQIQADAPFDAVMSQMMDAQKMLQRVTRPDARNPQAMQLYNRAREVSASVGRASDQAVRLLARAQGDHESDLALIAGMRQIVGDYQSAADAFLQGYAAARQQVATDQP